jgi:hypothetical protein
MRKTIYALLSAILLSGTAVAGALPAHAAYPTQDYYACPLAGCASDYANGTITWYNRTAGISGYVRQAANSGLVTQVNIDAFQGSTLIEHQARTVQEANYELGYGFVIGDPNLGGGIDRIRVTVCLIFLNPTDKVCGTPMHYWRKDAK